jgi:hypothetical protein
MWHVYETREAHPGFSWVDQRERDYLKDLGVDGRVVFKWIFKWDGAWAGLIWRRTRIGGGLL